MCLNAQKVPRKVVLVRSGNSTLPDWLFEVRLVLMPTTGCCLIFFRAVNPPKRLFPTKQGLVLRPHNATKTRMCVWERAWDCVCVCVCVCVCEGESEIVWVRCFAKVQSFIVFFLLHLICYKTVCLLFIRCSNFRILCERVRCFAKVQRVLVFFELHSICYEAVCLLFIKFKF